MGIYDRDYYREDSPRWGMTSSHSMVAILIFINIAVYIIDALWGAPRLQGGVSNLERIFHLSPTVWERPWEFYQLLSYGFLHDRTSVWHIFFNMFGLYIFGRDVEQIYGKKEFLRIYISLIVGAGLVWLIATNLAGQNRASGLIGASGGVMGIMILFVMHFPRRVFLIWGILPIQAWAMGLVYVLMDVMGLRDRNSAVAHTAHLGGAAFGYLYYRTHWCLATPIPRSWPKWRTSSRPRLRVVDERETDDSLSDEVDRILEKISREGEASLSALERGTLERASRKYQQRRR
jgi:membrane associated rhomboid family serine protease